MKAEIITIGDEILIGQVADTNSSWIAQQLHPIGIDICQITGVSDNKEHIIDSLNQALQRSEVVFITGGLGPTKDDITKKTLADYFESEFYLDEMALAQVTDIFSRRNLPMIEINRLQAMLPKKCIPLYNKLGTAPGMWFEHKNRQIISMPGVPYEMKAIMEGDVIPKLKDKYKLPVIIHRTFLTIGIGESFLAQKIEKLEDALPSYIKLAYLPHLNTIRLRFSARGEDVQLLKKELDTIAQELAALVPEYLVAGEDLKIEEITGKLLKEKELKLATAESCTGGYLAHLITSVSGSSEYFLGSIISYANSVKEAQLQVDGDVLEQKGAVSEEVVIQMAENVRRNLGADLSIATSGVAGPGGGTPEKPVGTVWIAVSSAQKTTTKKYLFHGSRSQIIERTAVAGLDMLRRLVLGKS